MITLTGNKFFISADKCWGLQGIDQILPTLFTLLVFFLKKKVNQFSRSLATAICNESKYTVYLNPKAFQRKAHVSVTMPKTRLYFL